ncbi:pleckstrin homology domain-containing family S member 1 isoform X2 [Oreochromis niloticus]|uniref:Pleckstrin homology domain containing S1, tandem duplicate 3 n=1 Tax=Oreochromis niloticus TaxID=8128 RepID=A0A669CW65_ORENI|nr:pleckstrin homology domain-containing family S member 1 isoform X2 [Oreochromis niloticus]
MNHKPVGGSLFYTHPKTVREVRAGYLHKSPPLKLITTEKAWKRRFFILFKLSDTEYQLRYFKSSEEKDKRAGEIDLSQVSLLHVSPQHHPKWNWIQKSFKCSPSCVLLIRATERDYFLVGENSDDVDGWFSDLFDAMKRRPHKISSSEEFSYKQATIEVISKPLIRKKNSFAEAEKGFPKIRSMSDPSSNTLENVTEKPEEQEYPKRRASEPVEPIYEVPRPQKNVNKEGRRSGKRRNSVEALYETMSGFRYIEESAQPEDHEVEDVNKSTLMRTVTQTFDKLKTQVSPLPPFAEETNADDNSQRWSTDLSSSSSDCSAMSPVELLDASEKNDSNESIDREIDVKDTYFRRECTLTEVNGQSSPDHSTEERDIVVNQAELKKHLTLTEVDRKPSVSGWTGQPQTVCLFHKGDQILAVNDLHVSTVEEFTMFISKSLKNEVKVTLLRQPGNQQLHLPNFTCTDWQNAN